MVIWLQEAFLGFSNFSPCFKCFSFDYIKAPPKWNSPLSFQEGFEIDTNLKFYFHIWVENLILCVKYSIWNYIILNVKFWRIRNSLHIPIENSSSLSTNWNTYFWKIPIWEIYIFFLNGGGEVLLLWAKYFPPI